MHQEFDMPVLLYLAQENGLLKQRQMEMFEQVIERLSQVLKFSLPSKSSQPEPEPAEQDDQDAEAIAGLIVADQAEQVSKPEAIERSETFAGQPMTLIIEKDGVILPVLAVARGAYDRYSPETAYKIMCGLPKAYQTYKRKGGRWGPGFIAEQNDLPCYRVTADSHTVSFPMGLARGAAIHLDARNFRYVGGYGAKQR